MSIAILAEDIDYAHSLIKQGVSPQFLDKNGNSILFKYVEDLAFKDKVPEIIRFLIKNKIDRFHRNKEHRNIFHSVLNSESNIKLLGYKWWKERISVLLEGMTRKETLELMMAQDAF